MGKQSRSKRERREHSTLDQHRRQGKKLVPPLASLPLRLSRWSDVRLPEMLWAALLVAHGPRLDVIEILRTIGAYWGKHSADLQNCRVTISGIAALPDVHRQWLLEILTRAEPARVVLSPLLLFDELPARQDWAGVLPQPAENAWTILAEAIRRSLFHQSQEATDAQWIGVFASLSSGQLHLPREKAELANEIAYYPHFGDQRKVRPFIRATAGAFDDLADADRRWADGFWKVCLERTPCFPLDERTEQKQPTTGTTAGRVRAVLKNVIAHASKTATTTAPDARHDTVFGIALYALALIEELLKIGNASTLMAKAALRTILEANITIAYLAKRDDAELWRSYRVFGSGQAKLVSLKIRDGESPAPGCIDANLVEQLANEDMWEEYVPIGLGHWENSNLRELADQAGKKDLYDQFYAWTSMFGHAHWGAVRATVFDVCGNPLHRLHRIPRPNARVLGDVLADAVSLADGVLDIVNNLYPGLPERLAVPTVALSEGPA